MATTMHHESVRQSPEDVARSILQNSSYQALRGLKCEFEDGVLKLEGTLPNFHMNQLALSALREIEGVTRIDNRVEVDR